MFREEQTVSLLFLKDKKTGLPTDTLINILPLVLYSLGTANTPEQRKKQFSPVSLFFKTALPWNLTSQWVWVWKAFDLRILLNRTPEAVPPHSVTRSPWTSIQFSVLPGVRWRGRWVKKAECLRDEGLKRQEHFTQPLGWHLRPWGWAMEGTTIQCKNVTHQPKGPQDAQKSSKLALA